MERLVGSRAWAYAVSAALIVAVVLPVLGDTQDDNFPLSTYPMFSGRKTVEAAIPHVVGIAAGGERIVLPPEAVANDEVVQAFETVRQAVRQGPEGTAALCQRAAAWAGEHGIAVASVAVVTDTYDAVRYFDGAREPASTVEHARCEAASR